MSPIVFGAALRGTGWRLMALGWTAMALSGPAWAASDPMAELMARMDNTAGGFKSMTGKLKKVQFTAVIKETTEESGTISMKAGKPKETQLLISFSEPDPKSWSFHNQVAELYYPKIQTVQVYDLGKHASLIDQFILLGFGTSSKDLAKNYSMKYMGEEQLNGQQTSRLELIPKSGDARQHLNRVEIWFPEGSGHPVQHKFYQKSGDYVVFTYSDVKLNPALADSAVKLNLPKNVKREYPQR